MTDLDTNSNYAVLIYYNNVSGGNIDYDKSANPRKNGPVTASAKLPTIAQWDNVNLSNTTRKIKDEKNAEYIDFSYSGYAARLLTTQEVVSACGSGTPESTGYLDNCQYLMENTQYVNNNNDGYWLEYVNSNSTSGTWYVNGTKRSVDSSVYFSHGGGGYITHAGVRPAIEVPKSKIAY